MTINKQTIPCERCGNQEADIEWSNDHEIQRQEDEILTLVCRDCYDELADDAREHRERMWLAAR